VKVYKGKGDALECGSYRVIKLLDHVMKVLESVIDKKVRSKVSINDMQFGFRCTAVYSLTLFVTYLSTELCN
jgi:hypothetical protein